MTTQTMPIEQDLDPVFLLADTNPEAMKVMNTGIVAAFRAANGKLDGAFDGVPLLLLTTTGARSGLARTTPVNYTRSDAAYVILASKSGSPRHPDWYHNLLADPRATIEVDGATLQVHARLSNGAEHERLFARHVAALPNFGAYQNRTSRQIPVLVLETRPAAG